jgi:ATP-dependent RNA/DNA helicase IGHMBP2
MKKHIEPSSIGVISPYGTQLNQLKSDLKAISLEEQVLTIDSMQGREKPIIIFSAVRSNPNGDLGFLSVQNRINVALTRAQHCLIIVGNSRTLQNSPDWKIMI